MAPIRTLVVDDSAPMRRAIVDELRSVRGCLIVGEGANGVEALELARALRPSLVVMDIHMPLMDGLEATRLLKTELPGTQIVLTSMTLEPGVRDAALNSGAIACLQKGEELREGLPPIVFKISQASQARPANT